MILQWFLIMAAIAAFASGASAEDFLPLQRGYYVSSDTPCEQASNATLNLFRGDRMAAAHAQCRIVEQKKDRDGWYWVTESCKDLRGGAGAKPEKLTQSYKVISRTEYILKNRFGEFRSRYCPQSSLPEPWRKIDLSDVIGAR
jgi:hypothetical protein